MIRKATIDDVKVIHRLLSDYAKDVVIPRSLSELYERLRDFFVYEKDGKVVGTGALSISWEDLAEIRSLVVADECRGSGGGKELVKTCLTEAKELGISNVFVLTYIPEYFEKFGFKRADKSELPHKVWSDCIKCPKFPDCDETALIKKI